MPAGTELLARTGSAGARGTHAAAANLHEPAGKCVCAVGVWDKKEPINEHKSVQDRLSLIHLIDQGLDHSAR